MLLPALVGVMASALHDVTVVTRGPPLLGSLFALAITLSAISLFGLGPFFWALILGTTVSLLLERDERKTLHPGTSG